MSRRLLPLLPLSLVALLTACASQPELGEGPIVPTGFVFSLPTELPESDADIPAQSDESDEQRFSDLAGDRNYQLPELADSVLELGFKLVGTPYRYGGSSTRTGFDCSGFVGFLFRKEAGIELPRSTREMINLDAPKVARSDLEPGDVVFFNNRGRGRVTHAGIYIGNDRFIHSASRRSGGVRVDSLDSAYWRTSFMQAKRILALAHVSDTAATHH